MSRVHSRARRECSTSTPRNTTLDGLRLVGLFRHVLLKPAFIADDQGWEWLKYTRILDLQAITISQIPRNITVPDRDGSGESPKNPGLDL